MKKMSKFKLYIGLPVFLICTVTIFCLYLAASDIEEQNKQNESASRHLAAKQYQAAIDQATKSLSIGTFGQSINLESIKSHLILGIGHCGLGDKTSGYKHLNIALATSIDVCGENNSNTFNVLFSMANIFRGEGDLGDARDLVKRALLVSQALETDTRQEAQCHRLLIEIYNQIKDDENVIVHTQILLDIFKKQPESDINKKNIELCEQTLEQMKNK